MITGLWWTYIPIFGSYLDFEGAKIIMSFKSWFGALEDAGGSWLVFDTTMIRIMNLHLHFEGAKNLHVI